MNKVKKYLDFENIIESCGNCDSIIPTNSKFCHECGNPIK